MDVTCEAFDDWTVVVHNFGLGPLEGRDELWDVEDFGFVKDTWTDFLYPVLEVIILDYGWVDLLEGPLAYSHYSHPFQARHDT